jgi:VWFA-related protein
MRRCAKIASIAAPIVILASLTAAPAKAQSENGDSSAPAKAQDANGAVAAPAVPLAAKPEPVAKPDTFTAPNPYEYPTPKPLPFVPAETEFETVSPAIATRLEPYSESRGGFATQGDSQQSQNEIRVYTNEVIAPVTVLDKRGRLVLDLEQKDFHIFDNGAEQKITHWDLGGDPLAVALVIETSSHIQMMAPVIRGMGSIFTETVMAFNGEAAVITFDSTVDVRQPFTTDHDAVESAISAVKFEAPEMRLYDAMAAAEDLLKAQPTTYRRVMLIVGESQDVRSDAKLRNVLRDAQLANITIYGVGVSSSKADLLSTMHPAASQTPDVTYTPPDVVPYIAPSGVAEHAALQGSWDYWDAAIWLVIRGVNKIKDHQLELAVAATGGVHYHAHRDRAVRSALDQIGSEVHAQYIVGYAPSAKPTDGFHTITVTIARPETTARTRPGYFLAPPADLTAPATGEATSHSAAPSPSSTPE